MHGEKLKLKNFRSHCTGSLVGHSAGLDGFKREQMCWPCRIPNPDSTETSMPSNMPQPKWSLIFIYTNVEPQLSNFSTSQKAPILHYKDQRCIGGEGGLMAVYSTNYMKRILHGYTVHQ